MAQPYNGRVMINGKLYEGEEKKEYCEKNGLCPMCGTTKVKEKKAGYFAINWTDIPVKMTLRGDVEVYKGYHIAPTCYSISQAKEALGETDEPSGKKQKAKRKNKRGTESQLTSSDRSREPQQKSTLLLDPESPDLKPLARPMIDAVIRPASETSDEVTHNSGSSQEQQTSSSSGNEPHVESPIRNHQRIPDNSQSPDQSNLKLISRGHFDTSGQERHSDGHIRTGSFENVARRPFSSSDPIAGHKPTLSTRDLQQNLPAHNAWHPSLHNVAHMPSMPTINAEDPVEDAIRDVAEEAERLDVYNFLIQLDCHRAKTEVIRKGLPLMRQLVFKIHQRQPEKRYVFPNDSWCKTIKSAMSEHDHDPDIQKEGVMTITFICSISAKYKADLIRNHNANEVIAAMDAHPSTEEACCVALECLTRKEGTNANWREDHALTAFEAIKTVLTDPSHTGTSYAILALYNLTCHDNFRQEFVHDHMLVILAEPGVLDTFSALMQDDSVSGEVMEAIISLLQRFWVRFLEDETESAISSPEAILSSLVGAMYIFGSESLHSGICDLLAEIPLPISTDLMCPISTDLMWKQTISDAIVNSMTRHLTVESVQLSGLAALGSLFGDPSRREEYVADLDQIVKVIVLAMDNFHENAYVQAKGCVAIASICSSGEWYQETVIRNGGIAVIVNAFESHVINVDPTEAPEADDVRIAASSALAILARSSASLSELRHSNLLTDFQTMLTRDHLYLDQPSIRTCAISLMSVAMVETDEDPEAICDIGGRFLMQNLDEADAQTLLMTLSATCSRTPNVIDAIISVGDGTGTSRIVDLLEEFSENASIQEAGCALLANIYFQVPFQGELNQSSHLSVGLSSVHVKTHSQREVDVISSALERHKANVQVVKNACEALCNFICGLNVVVNDPVDIHIPENVAAVFSGIPREVDSAMAIHEENPEAMKSVLRLVLVSVRLLGSDDLQRCSANLIARLFEIMLRLPQDEEIHRCACSILGRFVSIENDSILASTANAEGLRALLLSLHMENETVVSFTTGIISSLLQKVPTLINDIIEIEEYFGSLVDCMYRFPESVTIQAETSSILASLATLSDPYVKAIIANSGGVGVVMLALRAHRNQAYVVEYASKALAGMADGIPDTILLSARENICQELLHTLGSSSNMEGVVCATMEALCEFCSRDDYFDFHILESEAVPRIVDAMAQHINSGDTQKAGCKLVWLLSSKSDEYKRVLGALGAIRAMVTALLAHITSTAVVKEALTALKHVSRISANKEALAQSEATEAIRLTIYANLEDPQVISAALSALNDIAVDVSSREVNRVSDETMNCVLTAMQIHPSDLEVQKIACWLLRSLTFNHSNLTLMRSSREQLFELLLAASSLFPEECGERAQNILEKL